MNKQVLTTTEAAQHLKVHAVTVKRWIANGDLQAYREPGGRWRIPADALVKFLRERGIPFDSMEDGEPRNSGNPVVIVADDDPDIRRIVSDTLRQLFPQVRTIEVDDGLAACMQIGCRKPDLAILDVCMSNTDGIRVAQLVKDQPELSDTQILMMSGYLDPAMVEQLYACGVEGLLEKPFKIDELSEMIRELLRASCDQSVLESQISGEGGV
jgi:excisionase family DNA binding protein